MKFDPAYPLVLDVDGTLIGNDLTHDLLTQGMSKYPLKIVSFIRAGLKDKSVLKDDLVSMVGDTIDAAHLPYNETIIEIARTHKASGGVVVLCSGSHQSLVDKITAHFDWITDGFGTWKNVNLTKATKASFLAEKYPDGFHYIGNSKQDLPVWEVAQSASAVNPPASIAQVKTVNGEGVIILESDKSSFKTILKSIRVHQWVKNGLIGLVPLLTFASLTQTGVINLIVGFFAMSFLASATYIFNDLLDVPDDRQHHTKRNRPLASGKISVPSAILLMVALSIASAICLWFLPVAFAYVLGIYLALTLSYSLFFKRVPIADVIMLAGLFSTRVLAGAILVQQPVSPWLLNFVASFFLSLALVKRYTEVRKKNKKQDLPGRGYRKDDEPLLLSLGIMGTGLAVLSLLLYSVLAPEPVIQSQVTRFIILTVLTYWMMRIWFLAHRKTLDDDPVLFAVKDKQSLLLGLLIAVVVVFEQIGHI